MDVTVYEGGDFNIAVIESAGTLIADAQDALDLMMEVRSVHGCDAIVVGRSAIIESFFDLGSGVAGEILLKFTNYRFRMAVIGDFEHDGSESLGDFIRESNRGNQFFFLPTQEAAINRLRS